MINVLKSASLAAGEIIAESFYLYKNANITYKDNNYKVLVTETDTASQNIIRQTILDLMIKQGFDKNEVGFIGEENLAVEGKHKFIIDPLDGTTNFASHVPHFAISIGYLFNNELLASIVYNPITKDMYLAEKNKGSFKNGKKLEVKYESLSNSMVNAYINSPEQIYKKEFEIYGKIFPKVRGFRNLGCAALDLGSIAENVFNIYLNGHTFVWDVAAAKLIVDEAGGTIYDWQGQALELDLTKPKKEYQVIAGHKKTLENILNFFK